jgi:adenylate cyclase
MKKNTSYRKKMQLVLIIALGWSLFAGVLFIVQYFFVLDLMVMKKISGSYDPRTDLVGLIILGVVDGFIAGYILVFRLGAHYRKKSFAFGIIYSGLVFIVIYLAFGIVGLFIMDLLYFVFHMDLLSAVTTSWSNVLFNMRMPSFFINMALWAFLTCCTQFIIQVSDKFGPGILWKFITGKYYHPREEERIFMFLDLKSSTTIAEKTGSNKFFRLLKEIFSDITEPIINSRGEIYQYVGDEVIVTWPADAGLSGNNCLLCFYRIQQALEKRKDHYLEEYGVVPFFKAGIHIGEATVGEIGIIKKDIVFSGDVLNTTSRIQGECNKHNVSIILSSALLQRMPMNGEYKKIQLGEIQLRGKEEKLSLITIEPGQ